MKPRSTFTLAAFTLLIALPVAAGEGKCATCVDGPEMFQHRAVLTDVAMADIRAADIAEFPDLGIQVFSSPSPEVAPEHAYRVMFGVVVGGDRKVASMRVESVMDMRTGETAPESMAVPRKYVAAAKKLVDAHGFEPLIQDGKPQRRLMYFYLDPARPGRADLDFVVED